MSLRAVNPDPDDQPSSNGRVASANLREIIMGAQDNLTNVLAVVLGVSIGSGHVETVALAGLAAGVAEAISMGGVLYTSTRAERDLARAGERRAAVHELAAENGRLKDPIVAAAVTFASAIVAAMIPLAPFAVLPLKWATVASAGVSVVALFALGTWTGGVTGRKRWHVGLRFVAIGGFAALAAALVGAVLKTDVV